jgi:hypothetical protein
MILDYGVVRFCWLCLSVPFWIAATILVCFRKRPTDVETLLVGFGPVFLLCVAFVAGHHFHDWIISHWHFARSHM